MFIIKRVYEQPSDSDGLRVLVDRLWPRGLTKERAAVAVWMKEIAPSTELRKWFGHDPTKWKEFQDRYRKELAGNTEPVRLLKHEGRNHVVTLLYGARDKECNEAVVLKELLDHV